MNQTAGTIKGIKKNKIRPVCDFCYSYNVKNEKGVVLVGLFVRAAILKTVIIFVRDNELL
jgi:hypothetical protein